MLVNVNQTKLVKKALSKIVFKNNSSLVTDPMPNIVHHTGLAPVQIKTVLKKLADSGELKINKAKGTSGQQIASLELRKNLFQHLMKLAINEAKQPLTEVVPNVIKVEAPKAIQKRSTKPAETPTPALPAQPRPQVVAVLIDFDNIRGSQVRQNFSLSLEKVKQYIQGTGIKVLFADAFLSPDSNKQRYVNLLWNCGWTVISCPQKIKDKDTVDMKIKWQVTRYMYLAEVTKIIVISDDKDFYDLPDRVADEGKEFQIIDSLELKEHCCGVDIHTEGEILDRDVMSFVECLEHLQNNTVPKLSRQLRRFALIKAVCRHLDGNIGYRFGGFMSLVKSLQNSLAQQNFTDFSRNDFMNIVRALVAHKVVFSVHSHTDNIENFFVNEEHLLFKENANAAAR